MDFEKLVQVYEELEKTASGNKIREVLAEFFKQVPKDDVQIVAYLTLGKIASDYEDVVLGMAEKSVLKAITVASGQESSKVNKLMQKSGDVGLTAEEVMKNKPRTLVPLGKLTIHELFEKLHKMASSSGAGSQDLKTNLLAGLLQKSSATGAKYITRIALGTLRMGVGDMTVLDALAIAYTGDKSNKDVLEQAYNICPDIGIIAETLAKKGLNEVKKVDVYVGRPIKMMLGQRVKSLEEAQKKIPGEVTVEAKYDGERIQAHKNNKGKESSLINNFLYPRFGAGSVYREAANLIIQKNGQIILNSKVIGLEIKKGSDDLNSNVVSIQNDNNRITKIECDYVISSMPIKDLFNCLSKVPDSVLEISNNLVHRDYIIVGLLLDRMNCQKGCLPDNWIYIQEKDWKMGRL